MVFSQCLVPNWKVRGIPCITSSTHSTVFVPHILLKHTDRWQAYIHLLCQFLYCAVTQDFKNNIDVVTKHFCKIKWSLWVVCSRISRINRQGFHQTKQTTTLLVPLVKLSQYPGYCFFSLPAIAAWKKSLIWQFLTVSTKQN